MYFFFFFYVCLLAQSEIGTFRAVPESTECSVCVEFMNNELNVLINIILNAGVIGDCNSLCSYLPNQEDTSICDTLCDDVGIETFVKLLTDSNPDSIWICEQVKSCPTSNSAKAIISGVTVSPLSGPQGTIFVITISYAVASQIGTGELIFVVSPVNAISFSNAVLIVSQSPNDYSLSFKVPTQPSESEPFNPGTYHVFVALCEGTCGSSHDHSYTLATANSTFAVTSRLF